MVAFPFSFSDHQPEQEAAEVEEEEEAERDEGVYLEAQMNALQFLEGMVAVRFAPLHVCQGSHSYSFSDRHLSLTD